MFSIIMPMDADRFPQFTNTKRAYDRMPQEKQFVIVTRRMREVNAYLQEHCLYKEVHVVPYSYDGGFNPAMALNIGVSHSLFPNIIITCPEVRPQIDVLDKLESRIGRNVVCQVINLDQDGRAIMSLVNSQYRNETPGFYFLAMYNKKDIEYINGWDERFMQGHSHEDEDFGNRWVRAGLPFEIADDIMAYHQYHPPNGELVPGANEINMNILEENNRNKVTRCMDGLVKLPMDWRLT